MNDILDIFKNAELDQKKLDALEKTPDPKYRYIIAITPRSGSSYLSDVMANTKQFGKPGEFLNKPFIPNILKAIPARTPDEFLRNTMRYRASKNGVSGLKTSWFSFKNFKESLEDKNDLKNYKYIYLTRRDLDAQAVSLYRATSSNVFHTNIEHSSEAIKSLKSQKYDYNLIKQWYEHIAEQESGWQQYFSENDIFPLFIAYEDIEHDILNVLKRISKYIDLQEGNISLPETSSIFKKVGDKKNIRWTHRFALEHALEELEEVN